MFNSYKKSRLPKYNSGGTTDFYNTKRQEDIDSNGLTTDQYNQIAGSIAQGGVQAYAGYSNPDLNDLEKTRAIQAGADSAKTGIASAFNPMLGAAVGAVTKIGSGVQSNVDRTDANGNIINRRDSKVGEIAGGLLSPSNSLIGIFTDPNATTGEKIAGIATGGISDMFTNRHRRQVESNAKKGLFANGGMNMLYNAEGDPINNGNTGVNNSNLSPQMINQILNNLKSKMKYKRTIEDIPMRYKREITPMPSQMKFKKTLTNLPYNMNTIPQATLQQYYQEPELKFSNGGEVPKEFANSEVEKQENTLNPDGTSSQFNGNSHENGGIPVNLDPGTLIFSDRLKHKGKTFASLNKANNTNKEDKILSDPKSSNTSKQTAQLMKDAKIKNSLSLFQIQEELKQSKVDNYTKRLGGIQKYPDGGAVYNPNMIEPTSRLTSKQWNDLNMSRGYQLAFPDNKLNPYPEYYNPNEYTRTSTGTFIKAGDNEFTDYNNDSSYRPFIKYNGSLDTSNSKQYIQPTSNRTAFDFQTDKTGYKYNDGSVKYFDKTGKQLFRKGGVKLPNTSKELNFDRPKSSYKYGELNRLSNGQLDLAGIRNKDYLNNIRTPYNYNSNYISPEDEYNRDLLEAEKRSQITEDRPNWFQRNKDGLYQAGFGLAQSAGQLAYLAEQGKKYDTQQYYNYSPTLLDPSASLRDADIESRRAEYGLRNASGGNSANYLANRIGLSGKIIQAKDNIRQQYANQNAQLSNQGQMFNIGNKYRTDEINAQNKGVALQNYYDAIGSTGRNVAQGMKDNRMFNNDNQSIEMLGELYNSPEFKEFLKNRNKSKGKG